jgi:S-DNA-T family DNA segregation ATPase FtsK/SpoIIIE
VLATLAPVIASLAMWAIMQSVFALMFAVLGPLVAIGSVIDARLQGRRRTRRELARFRADVAATVTRIAREHARLRAERWRRSRPASALLPPALHDAERWRYTGGPVPVVVGTGSGASGVRLSGAAPTFDRDAGALDAVDEELQRLSVLAHRIEGVPVALDATLGIGICGPRVTALGAARSIVLQLADALPPGHFTIDGGFEEWHAQLPHARPDSTARDAGSSRLDFVAHAGHERSSSGGTVTRIPVVVAESAWALPRECRIGLEVVGAEVRLLRHPQLGRTDQEGIPIVPARVRAEFVSCADASVFATTLAAAAKTEGLAAMASPPERVDLAEVWDAAPQGVLPATFLVDSDGAMSLDLVTDGPHAVVGGTTGSGKSELLVAWILAMARVRPPSVVTFLLVDFKGGASFGAVAGLPHCVGLITDLDQAAASRALESLRAELRHRERAIAAAGARSIDDLDDGVLPRLVVVVDEFAAMVSEFAELHALFADIAARGRSLGLHVILCTQRPGAALRDAVMANCTLRVSLRVNNGHDSAAVIGSDAAAGLPRHPVGRCLVSVAGASPRLAQVAIAVPALAEAITGVDVAAAPRRPWLPPLPDRVDLSALPAIADGADDAEPGGIAFGLLDLPEEQRQAAAVWQPVRDGNLLVIGTRGAGKSVGVAAIVAAARAGGTPVIRVDHEIESAWDEVIALADRRPGHAAAIVAIDDLDALLSRMPDHASAMFVDAMTTLLREGSSLGITVVASVQRLTAGMQPLVPLFGHRLLLRMPTRQDLVMSGGEGVHHAATAPPGRGRWLGAEVQVAVPDRAPPPTKGAGTRQPLDLAGPAPIVIVTSRPALVIAGLERLGLGGRTCAVPDVPVRLAAGGQPIAVGDPMAWQASWSAFAALRALGPVVFDRCTPAEFRLVTGMTMPLPPLSSTPGGGWMLSPHGDIARVDIPIAVS